MPEEGHNVLVATAIISITLNPLLFANIDRIERWLQRAPALWKFVNARASKMMDRTNADAARAIAAEDKELAIIVGYGPVGRVVDALLRDTGLDTVIIDLNMDTIQSLTRSGRKAIYGDAGHAEVLEQAGAKRALHLVVTLPHVAARGPLVLAARELNSKLEITVRARYLRERDELQHSGANKVVYEEGEAGIALARHVMQRRGVDQKTIDQLPLALRRLWGMDD
jgi:CPA2 family monovalent cation:H+ antiporter-2